MDLSATILAMVGFAATAIVGVLARPLLPGNETRYLVVAWETRVTGAWLAPHRTARAPRVVDSASPSSPRAWSELRGVAAIGATGALARRLWPDGSGVGGSAALALAGLDVFALFSGLTTFDAMLTLAVVLGVLALVETVAPPPAGADQTAAASPGWLAEAHITDLP